MTYLFLQQYWWLLVSLLGALFVMLTFVQGANALIFTLGKTETERQLIVNSTGRKWELTFTTLVTFGGAFFASFPLFYSTSFGGAYWVWMLILLSFVLQAVAYEFQSKPGNLFGTNVYRVFLLINGIVGPLLVGIAVSTFFHGAEFVVTKDVMGVGGTISQWASPWGGLEAVANPWNVVLGLTVALLSVLLGLLYILRNIADETLAARARKFLWVVAPLFVVLFLLYVGHLLMASGWAVAEDGGISIEEYKYLHNLLQMPVVAALFLIGVIGVLAGIVVALFAQRTWGFWLAAPGAVLTVMALLLLAGWNGTCYYPSLADTASSLHIGNSCSGEFTLRTMFYVSLIIPFVVAYIAWAWHTMDKKAITKEELTQTEDKY